MPELIKDIDEYLRGVNGDRHREFKRLQGAAVDVLTWEVMQAAKLEGLEARHGHLKEHGVYKAVGALGDLEQELFIDKIVRLTSLTPKAVHEALETDGDLLRVISDYYEAVGEKNVKSRTLGEKIYKWFNEKGKFFYNKDGKAYLFYNKSLYEIGNNNHFNSMMDRRTHLSAIEAPGKNVWYWLETFCAGHGTQIQLLSWIHTDKEKNSIYVNFSSPNNTILKLSPKKVEEIPNATNPDGVLLDTCPAIKPARFIQGTKAREALELLRTLLFDNLTCELTDRYLILCWLISYLFTDYSNTKGFMKFEGDAQSGKSSAGDLCFALLYGEGKVGQMSAAAAFRLSGLPLLVIDNMESADLTRNFKNILLMARDGRGRDISKGGTDNQTINQTLRGLLLWTAIEPIPGSLSELMTGAFTVLFHEKFKKRGFMMLDVVQELLEKRDIILSGLLDLAVNAILPNLKEGRRRWLNHIESAYPKHNKNRANEVITVWLLILEEVVKVIPFFDKGHINYGEGEDAGEILKHWIKRQDALAGDISVGSNSIVNFLDGLYLEYEEMMREKTLVPEEIKLGGGWLVPAERDREPVEVKGFESKCHFFRHPTYLIDLFRSVGEKRTVKVDGTDVEATVKVVQFDAKMADLHKALNRYCREHGIRNPYESPSTLGRRISNDRETLLKSGWLLLGKQDGALHNRVVNGTTVYRFRKELVYGV